MFDIANRIVSGIANCPAGKRRQVFKFQDAHRLDLSAEFFQGVLCDKFFLAQYGRSLIFTRLAGGHLKSCDRDLLVPRLKQQERFRSEKTVAPHFFTADHAFEEARTGPIIDFAEGADWSQGIAEQPPVDRYIVGRTGEVAEFGSGRSVFHERLG